MDTDKPAATDTAPAAPDTPAAATPAVDAAALEAKVRSDLLAKLGYKSLADAERAVKAQKEAEQARMTEQERTAARLKELEPYEGRVKEYESAFKEVAEEALAALSEQQRKVVLEFAGDDPRAQLKHIKFLRMATPEKPTTTTTATTTTAPAKPPAPSGAPTPYERWQGMVNARSPLAAVFYQQNAREIEATKPN